jgi:hypothetical protein
MRPRTIAEFARKANDCGTDREALGRPGRRRSKRRNPAGSPAHPELLAAGPAVQQGPVFQGKDGPKCLTGLRKGAARSAGN